MKCFMWHFKYIIILCFILFLNIVYLISDQDGIPVEITANIDTLVHVHALWRHGDRTPVVLLPNDKINDEKSWKIGLGELTEIGIEQEYRLGKWLRKRYDKFLSRQYSANELYVRSTDYNRTLMSAQAVLMGLYPSKVENPNGEQLPWWPIPVHTVSKEDDNQLYEDAFCPAAIHEKVNIFSSNDVLILEEKNHKILSYIGSKIYGNGNTLRLSKIWFAFDPLNAVYHHPESHQFPSWMTADIWKELTRLYDVACQLEYSTESIKRLRGGVLLKEIIERLDNISKSSTKKISKKFHAYSAHDNTLGALLAVLGVQFTSLPFYSSLILIEAHRHSGDYFIQLFYKNVTDSDQLYRIPIGICGDTECTLKTFKTRAQMYVPGNWKEECGIVEWRILRFETFLGIISVSLFLILLLTCIVAYLIRDYLAQGEILHKRTLLPTTDDDTVEFSDLDLSSDDERTSFNIL